MFDIVESSNGIEMFKLEVCAQVCLYLMYIAGTMLWCLSGQLIDEDECYSEDIKDQAYK